MALGPLSPPTLSIGGPRIFTGGSTGGFNLNGATKLIAASFCPYEKQTIKTVTVWLNTAGSFGAGEGELRIHPPVTGNTVPYPDTATTLSGPHTFTPADKDVSGPVEIVLSSAYTYDPTAYSHVWLTFKNLNSTPASNYYHILNHQGFVYPTWTNVLGGHHRNMTYDGSTWAVGANATLMMAIEDEADRLIMGTPTNNFTDTTDDIYGSTAYWTTIYIPPVAGLTQWIMGVSAVLDHNGEDLYEFAAYAGLPESGKLIPNTSTTKTHTNALADEASTVLFPSSFPWNGGLMSFKWTASGGSAAGDSLNIQVYQSDSGWEYRDKVGLYGRQAVQPVKIGATTYYTPFSCFYNGSTFTYTHDHVPMQLLSHILVRTEGLSGGSPRTRSQAAWRQ